MQTRARKRANDYSTSLLDLCSCGLAILLLLLVLFVPQPRANVAAEATGSGAVERFVTLEVIGESSVKTVPTAVSASLLRINGQRVNLGRGERRVSVDIPSIGVSGQYEVRVRRRSGVAQIVHQVVLKMEEADRLVIQLRLAAFPDWTYTGQISTASGDAASLPSYTNIWVRPMPPVLYARSEFRGSRPEPITATAAVEWPEGDRPRFPTMKLEPSSASP